MDQLVIKATCIKNLTTATYRKLGDIELYDENERKRKALIELKYNQSHFNLYGLRHDKFRRRVEQRILLMQEPIRFHMENRKTGEERRVLGADELIQAINDGFQLSLHEYAGTNPCRDVYHRDLYSTEYQISGSPFQTILTTAQSRAVARAVWRDLFIGTEDSIIVEMLPHVKLSKTVFSKLHSNTRTSTAAELLYAFYNQSRITGWWGQLREYRKYLRDNTNLQVYARLVADYYCDAIGLQKAIPSSWRTSTVMQLLRAMRESEDFSPMPILADALQDAGCDDDALLKHYRNPLARYSLGSWIFRATGLI